MFIAGALQVLWYSNDSQISGLNVNILKLEAKDGLCHSQLLVCMSVDRHLISLLSVIGTHRAIIMITLELIMIIDIRLTAVTDHTIHLQSVYSVSIFLIFLDETRSLSS